MKRLERNSVSRYLAIFSTLCALLAAEALASPPSHAKGKRFTEEFNLGACSWSSTGRNDYFVLEPGYSQEFDGREGGQPAHLVITVLDETRSIAGVETRIVEERETHGGELIEVSRNYYAICKPANDVFYFGEDVDMYKNGKVASHEGSWNADTAGAHAGLFMPARPLLGARFYQEVAPKVAMDRVEIASDAEVVKAPAGEFRDCIRTDETTPLEPGVVEHKTYARGVGLVQDGAFLLTRHGSQSH